MDMPPGRSIYSPDEELKPLRSPKIYRRPAANEQQQQQYPGGQSTSAADLHNHHAKLSINATAFVPQHLANNAQERLERIQKQYLQENYPQQQQLAQQQQQQAYNQQTAAYANGYGGGYQGQQQQQLNHQFSSMSQRYNNHHHYNNQQNNHQYHHNHNHHQQRNQPYSQQQQHQHQPYSNQAAGGAAAAAAADAAPDMQNIALDYLQTVIQCLNQNPGQFDTIATRFITIFEGLESNHYVLSIAMEDIFEESIKNPNFRYMGAKLYNLLHMLNPSKDSLFHTLLKCKLDFHQDEIKNYMQSNQQGKVRETALFLAELYMQLRGDDTRIYLIAENIVYSLKQLLDHVVAENVRCICLTLKLAGYDLSTDCPEDMKEIIASLERINSENPGKYPLASNVISLQKNNWGRKAPGSEGLGEGESSKPTEPPRQSDDPVFYGPDGREITAEECEFLTNGASGANGGSTDNDDDNDLDDLDPEMDEETERDYKMFLKQANNS
ncbi:polyadenylate-binding protein-interacting protein 1 [Musca vetustissima]|uniref:polyadenylate-binding protein-interacting protein 1 n=1 Tax=Musca vetustissima TaxID=27455 RepID=UPI002AB62A5E|nr:polyadenylate-binding protein-interacting protein 1 [Musca vetustissima]